MKRVIVDYAKLTNEILNLLVEKFPDGYDDSDIIRFKNAKNELVEAVEVRTEDTIYLVKVSTKLSDRIENYDEDDEILNVAVEPIKELELDEDDADDDEGTAGAAGSTEKNKDIKDFNYLLRMPISQLTYDRKIILEKEVDELNKNLNNLRNNRIEDLWMNDLVELEKAWDEHREAVIKEYDNDRKGIIEPKATKKKAKK